VLWLAALSFFVLGIVLVVLGVLQADMARDLGLSLAQHGLLGAILALGFRPAPAAGLLVACGATAALAIGAAAFGSWSPVLALTAAGLALGPVYPRSHRAHRPSLPASFGICVGPGLRRRRLRGFALPWLSGVLGDALTVKASIVLLAGSACTLAIAALMLPTPAARATA